MRANGLLGFCEHEERISDEPQDRNNEQKRKCNSVNAHINSVLRVGETKDIVDEKKAFGARTELQFEAREVHVKSVLSLHDKAKGGMLLYSDEWNPEGQQTNPHDNRYRHFNEIHC